MLSLAMDFYNTELFFSCLHVIHYFLWLDFMGCHTVREARLTDVDHFETVCDKTTKNLLFVTPTNMHLIQPCSILTGESHSKLHSQF